MLSGIDVGCTVAIRCQMRGYVQVSSSEACLLIFSLYLVPVVAQRVLQKAPIVSTSYIAICFACRVGQVPQLVACATAARYHSTAVHLGEGRMREEAV